ncbi:nitrate- and nitrite sensing domain-containing protein [Streptomyces sp. NPDC048196]|uniref:nitrate- and nitrite sensing domain-containing protein n=1 Tax=Streptomyces sp. NPDC048196 TaxID=3154712 RepID=UPI0033F04FDA
MGPRPARVRNRLVGAVAVVAVAVLGAGAPGLLGTADDAGNSQHLVDLAELNARAIALAHSLADERDGMTGYAAAGRNGRTGTGENGAKPGTSTGPGNGTVNGTGSSAGTGTVNGTRTGGATGTDGRASTGGTSTTGGSGTTSTTTGGTGTGTGTGLPGVNGTRTNTAAAGAAVTSGPGADNAAVARPQRARVDRQIDDLRTEAQDASGDSAVYATAAKLLKTLPETRQMALARTESAEQVYRAYTDIIQALGAISDDIARGLPARADSADADTRALPALARATDQAAGTRALLLAGLNAGGSQPTLTGLAQVARVREQAALGDFRETAGQGARDRYDRTVTGTDISTAERYLTRLTDQPRLDAADLRLSRQRVENALTTRIGLMRGVESAMATADIQRLGQLRDDDVTELEIRIGLEGLCLLLAVGAGIWAARSMTQPLAALRIGARRVAADPAHEDPITYKGRNDEFAATVRSVNALHTQVGELSRRTTELEGERKRLIGGRQRLVAEREVLQEQGEALKEEIADLTERLKAAHTGVQGRFVNLALRTLGLVERQLGVIEGLEETEQDPERLDTLFKLDHFAARMRRNSENLLVLAGAEQHGNNHPGPVPLLDVLRAAVSEIERYERVRIQSLPPHSQVAGFAADDLSHLVAELLENATAFSPPDAYVELSGWLLESGEVMLSVQDEGIGMTAERMAELNERLTDAEAASTAENIDEALGLGLYVVVRLAARHGVRVQLRDAKQGGVTAVIVLPGSILPTRPGPASSLTVAHDAHAPGLPGSVAEANSNALPTRVPRLDPAAGRGAAEPAPAPERAADPAPGQDGPAGSPEGDPFVAAAERALDAAGIPAGGTAEHTRPREDAPEEPAPAVGPAAADPYAIGPDQHTRAEAATPATAPAPTDTAPADQAPSGAAPDDAASDNTASDDEAPAGPEEKQRTSLGLPKRTPKIVAQQQAPTAPRKSGAANAEALRRRLGGFQQGARTGRRDVAAELAEGTTERTDRRPDTDGAGAPEESHIVEEARE